MEVTEREIDFEDALSDQGDMTGAKAAEAPRPRPGAQASVQQPNIDQPVQTQASPAPPPDNDGPENESEILTPKNGVKVWQFGKNNDGGPLITYYQRELSVIAKIQWFSLVGEMFDEAIGGENAISLNTLLTPPEGVRPGQQFRVEDFRDADTFVHAIGKLFTFMPKFLEKSVCIWLCVPDYEWDLVRSVIKQSPELGGMSDDDAQEMLEVFIDQNYIALRRFFQDRLASVRARWNARAKEYDHSRSVRR